MSDNITIDVGPSPTAQLATDDVGGAHYQKIKLYDPTADSTAGIGVPSNPLSVRGTPLVIASVSVQEIKQITTNSAVLIAANSSRKVCWVTNISDADIFVSLSGTATTSTPTKLVPGASLIIANGEWAYQGAISAIHGSSGNKALEVFEAQ